MVCSVARAEEFFFELRKTHTRLGWVCKVVRQALIEFKFLRRCDGRVGGFAFSTANQSHTQLTLFSGAEVLQFLVNVSVHGFRLS